MRLSSPVLNPHLGDLKPFKIPQGFTLIIDTREQRPLFTSSNKPKDLPILSQKLNYGDYSIRGFTDKFAIERKQISDFYSYIGKEREKTVQKMNEFDAIIKSGGWVGLIIECSEEEILWGLMISKVSPEVARQAINSFRVRYNIHIYYSKNRDDLCRFTLDSAIKFYNIQREVR